MTVCGHMAELSLFMRGSAHASRASTTNSHSKGLYGGFGGSTGTPTHPDMGPTGLGKNPFKKNFELLLELALGGIKRSEGMSKTMNTTL